MIKTAMILLMTGSTVGLFALITIVYLVLRLPRGYTGKLVMMERNTRILLIASVAALMAGSVFCAAGFLLDNL